MRKKGWFTALMCLMVLLSGCMNTSRSKEEQILAYHRIEAEQAKRMMDEGNVIIVDVRTEGEYKEKHIPAALHVPNDTIEETASKYLPDKEARYLIYCRSGSRSKQASLTLVSLGYQNIFDFGGINNWPYETE